MEVQHTLTDATAETGAQGDPAPTVSEVPAARESAVTAPETGEIQTVKQPEDPPLPRSERLTEREKRFCYLRIYGPPETRRSPARAYARAFDWDQEDEYKDLPEKKRWEANRSAQRLLKKHRVQKEIERHQENEREHNQISQSSWITRAIEMRDAALERESFAAAAKLHRDVGEVLGLFTTHIEISQVPRSGDVLSEIAQFLQDHPELAEIEQAKEVTSVSRPLLEPPAQENEEEGSSSVDTEPTID